MKPGIRLAIVIFLAVACMGCSDTEARRPGTISVASRSPSQSDIPEGASKLIRAYPDFHLAYKDNLIVFSDGTAITYDDHKKKSFVELMDNSDIKDMFSMKYDRNWTTPPYLSDAGRSRNDQFFKKMYGNSAAAVAHHLVNVNWFGSTIRFTTVNGAAKHLRDVAREIARHPKLRKYMAQSSSFYWRKVRGANRQSAHSYGIAIDICTKYSNFWLWSNPGKKETDRLKYENRIPEALVRIFERHGFIWGGHWYHFDTMHFEYRPELLLP